MGYATDRLLQPCMKESFFLAEEGVSFERIGNILWTRLGMSCQPLHILSERHSKDILLRQKKESVKAFQKYLRDKEEEKRNPSTAFKPQPSSLPERQNPDEVIEIVIRPPVVLSNWDSKLANSFFECKEILAGQHHGVTYTLTATGQKIFDDFNAQKVSG